MQGFSVVGVTRHILYNSSMLMRQEICSLVEFAVMALPEMADQTPVKFSVDYPANAKFGDYSTNVAMILAKKLKTNPLELAQKICDRISGNAMFEKIEVAAPGFLNFYLSKQYLAESLARIEQPDELMDKSKILVEYFQPNIAKPLHIGHLRTALIGDAITRGLKYLGYNVESDTHMGDWGTQFGLLILAYKKYGNMDELKKDPVTVLNQYYIKINADVMTDPSIHEAGKQEFAKLEQGDEENRKIWKMFVDWSMEKFLTINDMMDILPFDHHWPESFYEIKMPAIVGEMKEKGILVESQGAWIVNLEDKGLGIAVIVKSDGSTTYLLRDLATFRFRKEQGFAKQLYVVDSRQSHHYRQLFQIMKIMGDMKVDEEAMHIDYGFISFKGESLSTRKGNMVLVDDVIKTAEEKVAKIIAEKNPELENKAEVINTIAKGALKYYDLSHNRRSDIDFDWDEALNFDGNTGPYLQYTYARLSSILRKAGEDGQDLADKISNSAGSAMSETEHRLAADLIKLPEIVTDSMRDYLPNALANYLYSTADLANRFYHESPVAAETDLAKKELRIALVKKTRKVLAQGLNLLGIKVLEQM